MILVTAPTGNIGRQVIARLVDGPELIRVIVRDPSKLAPGLRDRIEVVCGSHGDAAVIGEAFEGVDSLFWLPPGDPTSESAAAAYVAFSRPARTALNGGSIKRVVAISALGRGWPGDAGQVTATLAADDLFAETGVAYRALACGSLMENTLRQLTSIRTEGVIYGPSNGERKGTAVAACDVAICAADLLLQPFWHGVDEIPLKGPALISPNEIAATISTVLGKPIIFRETQVSELHAALIDQGSSPGMADATVALVAAKAAGLDELIEGSTPAVTPTSFAEWCETVLRPAVG